MQEVELKVSNEDYFTAVKDMIEPLNSNYPETSLRLYLHLALCADQCDLNQELDEFIYDVASQALIIYQDELSDQKVKVGPPDSWDSRYLILTSTKHSP